LQLSTRLDCFGSPKVPAVLTALHDAPRVVSQTRGLIVAALTKSTEEAPLPVTLIFVVTALPGTETFSSAQLRIDARYVPD
jgi:hypothetical protein